jgi:hypothetical protein
MDRHGLIEFAVAVLGHFCCVARVRKWHETVMAVMSPHVRCWGVNGLAGPRVDEQRSADAVTSPTTAR